MLLATLAILLPAILLVFVFSPVRVKIIYHRLKEDDYFALEFSFFWGHIPLGLEIVSVKGPGRFLKPLLKIRSRISGGKKAVAKRQSTFTPQRLYRLLRQNRKHFRLFKPSFQYLARKTKLVDFCWDTTLGLEDAAATGLATGILWIVKGNVSAALLRFTGKHYSFPRLHINPVFNRNEFNTRLDCIFEIRPGHIMISGMKLIKIWLLSRLNPGSERNARATASN